MISAGWLQSLLLSPPWKSLSAQSMLCVTHHRPQSSHFAHHPTYSCCCVRACSTAAAFWATAAAFMSALSALSCALLCVSCCLLLQPGFFTCQDGIMVGYVWHNPRSKDTHPGAVVCAFAVQYLRDAWHPSFVHELNTQPAMGYTSYTQKG